MQAQWNRINPTKPLIHDHVTLHKALRIAMQIEHFTIPPYLCAQYSIMDGTNREAQDVIQTVLMEEMLHMVLVGNLLRAVGGESRANDPAYIPTYPSPLPHFAHPFELNLRKFGTRALDLFIEIEKPEEPCNHEPEDLEFESIGQFYDTLEDGLTWMCETYGEDQVFIGRNKVQVTREHYYGGAGKLFRIENLEHAKLAIEQIKIQGEGLPRSVSDEGPGKARAGGFDQRMYEVGRGSPLHVGFDGRREPAHYFRFKEIREERYYQKGDTPETGPRGPEFPVQWDRAWNMQVNPKSGNYSKGSAVRNKMDECNAAYSRLLDHLNAAFNGTPDCLPKAVGDMFEVKHRSTELMRIPNELPELEDTTVGPSFEYLAAAQRPK